MDMALDNIVPESLNWQHVDEGPESVFLASSPLFYFSLLISPRFHHHQHQHQHHLYAL